jgi:hypothetical protein
MKKVFFLMVVSTLILAGCTNENSENPIPLGDVVISGTIVSDLDEDEGNGDLPLEPVPANVPVFILDANTGAILAETVRTNAQGVYTVTVKVGGPKDIEIVVGDFNVSINVFDNVEDDFVRKDAIYNDRQSRFVFNAVKGASYIQNIEINQPTPIDFE